MYARDMWRDGQTREGSYSLLEALWSQHPRRMRMEFICGRAVKPQPIKVDGRKPVDVANEQAPIAFPKAGPRLPLTGAELIQAVADAFDISYGELIGEGRSRYFVEARVVVVMVLRERGWSFPRIGRLIGGRDHSTIIHAHSSFDIHAKRNPMVAALFNRFRPERIAG
jgi:hypothetical protein